MAVNASNVEGAAALIGVIYVEYTDGTSDNFNTDASWKTLRTATPSGFQNPGISDYTWISASQQGLEGVAPWGNTTLPYLLDLTQANWIWTNENVKGVAPVGARAFRKTVTQPCGKQPVCAKVVITA